LRSSGKTSNLVISHKSKQHQKAGGHEEPFDPQKVDDYLSDISSGVQSLASTLERVRRSFTFEIENDSGNLLICRTVKKQPNQRERTTYQDYMQMDHSNKCTDLGNTNIIYYNKFYTSVVYRHSQ
jgi:hypothetical protein